MSIEEGLVSTDVDKIKSARRTAKGQVTTKTKSLKSKLKVKDGKFEFDKIEEEMVQELYQKLNKTHDDFQNLHDRFLQYRESKENADEEKTVLENEEIYSDNVRDQFSEIEGSYVKYKKALAILIEEEKKALALKAEEEKKALAEEDKKKAEEEKKKVEDSTRERKIEILASEIEAAKIELESKKKLASGVIKSADEHRRSSAAQMREELTEALSNYKSKVAEYKAAVIFRKSGEAEEKYAPAEDLAANVEEVDELKVQLSAVISKAKALGESIIKETSTNPINTQSDSTLVKLQKLTCPKFSGSPRDYGHFRRDFLELVKVPGRSDIEIGTNLKTSIPEKFQHLINHL